MSGVHPLVGLGDLLGIFRIILRRNSLKEPCTNNFVDLIISHRFNVRTKPLKEFLQSHERLLAFLALSDLILARRQRGNNSGARDLGDGLLQLLDEGYGLVRQCGIADRHSGSTHAMVGQFVKENQAGGCLSRNINEEPLGNTLGFIIGANLKER